jgi:hypothetical protein
MASAPPPQPPDQNRLRNRLYTLKPALRPGDDPTLTGEPASPSHLVMRHIDCPANAPTPGV